MNPPERAKETLAGFADALLDHTAPAPTGLFAWNGRAAGKRYDIYRNNVREGLVGALEARHPVTSRLVGKPFFAILADHFIAAHPPRSPVLLEWGDAFGDFTAAFEAAESVPYLPDIIRLEGARNRAYHAADMDLLLPDRLAAIDSDELEDLVLTPHPAMTILRSAFPVATIWEMNQPDAEPRPPEHWTGEDVLITRPRLHVEMRILAPGSATFLQALKNGQTLGSAAGSAANETSDFDPVAALTTMIASGAFSEIGKTTP